MKPIPKRSPLRFIAGRAYHMVRRYMQWYVMPINWADIQGELLPCVAFEHRTPLLRDLPEYDMWMQHNKIINLNIAVQHINRLIVHPQETFSYWRCIGKPTSEKGYLEGMVLVDGRIKSGVGGGLCQLSNLIYWMTLHTPLTVVERHRHSYDVFPDSNRTQPFGSGATCAYPYIDLQVKNNTTQTYQLEVFLTDDQLVGKWRSEEQPPHKYQVYEKAHRITHDNMHGYLRHNIIHREVYNQQDQLIDDEYVTENHAVMMYEPFLPDGQSDNPSSDMQPR